MRARTGLTFILLSLATALLLAAACAQTPTATPSPAPGGIIPAIVYGSSDVASWLTGLAEEYAGSPLWQTLAGMAIIVLIVSLIMWMRRPKRPLETKVPL